MRLLFVYAIAIAIGYLLRKKFPIFRQPAIYIFLPAALFSPLALFGVLFGLAGSNGRDYLLMGAGYILILVFSFAGLKHQKLLLLSLFGVAIAAFGA